MEKLQNPSPDDHPHARYEDTSLLALQAHTHSTYGAFDVSVSCGPCYQHSHFTYSLQQASLTDFIQCVLKIFSLQGFGLDLSAVSCHDMQEISDAWRNIPTATDVLSFPQLTFAAPLMPSNRQPQGYQHLGDVVICLPKIMDYARTRAVPTTPVYALLHTVCHGILHLLGHDHMHEQERTLMEDLETQILQKTATDHLDCLRMYPPLPLQRSAWTF